MKRAKGLGIAAYVWAQRNQLQKWLESTQPLHAIVTRTIDDTNVWLSADLDTDRGTEAIEDNDKDKDNVAAGESNAFRMGRTTGRMRVGPLLGYIQRICIRCKGRMEKQTVQVHTPSQVLPKARSRVSRCFKQTF